MPDALVTGGAGFIGSALVRRLLQGGHGVVVLDDLSTGRRDRLPAHPQLRVVVGDVTDRSAVDDAVAGCTTVFHHAAIASVARSVADPARSLHVGVVGTAHVLAAAAAAGARRIVFASSSSVYGDDPTDPKSESGPVAPQSPYAVGKLASEHLLATAPALYGVTTVALRYFNVYGPDQDPNGDYAAVIPRFVQAALDGRAATFFGDGGHTRDFCYVQDVVDANIAAAHAADLAGGVFNVGTGEPTSVAALHAAIARAVTDATGRPVPAAIRADPRPGDVRHSRCDPTAAQVVLGWRATTPLAQGLLHTVAAATIPAQRTS